MQKHYTILTVLLIGLLSMMSLTSLAQVTTSSMRGTVSDDHETLAAATVRVTHTPSGTTYNALTDAEGRFFINNMRVGGPYTVKVTFIGYRDHITEGITLQLGQTFVLDVRMSEDSELLEGVTVTAESKNAVFNSQRTGALTSVSPEQLKQLPTITRSLSDFTRLTPQANGGSFAGRDGRMNNVTIDGGAFRNNFGLSSNMMPGGTAQPISLDAIEEVSVNIAPFDIRLSNFTGASVNAVTKSGTNIFTGSAYTYQRGKGMTGTKIGDVDMSKLDNKNEQTYGFTIGGPIVKDKLFFFASAEYENDARPYTGFLPSENGVADKKNNISRTSYADLEAMSKFLKEKYNYDAGDVRNFPNMDQKNYKILAKIDWNINDDHHLSLRYNYLNNNSWNTTSWTSGPKPRLSMGRISEAAIAFPNAWYQTLNKIHGFAGELNSRFGNNATNKLMVTYTATTDPERKSPSAKFPFVDIFNGKDIYMSFGTELFSYNNKVVNNTFSISDDFTYTLGSHTLLAGLRYDNIFVQNGFVPYGTSYYRYASMEDFMNNKKPEIFGITYGYNHKDAEGVQMDYGLMAIYLQDEWAVTPRFKVSPGIRFEMPLYHSKLENNPQVDRIKELRYNTKIDISSWPDPQILINPRVGFNWDLLGDRSIQMRGGTGLFSGLMPFVWLTNQPTNSGVLQSPKIELGSKALPDDMTFEPDFSKLQDRYPDLFPLELDTNKDFTGEVDMAAKDFRMPQIWRTNLAFDFALPLSTTLTLEALYSKDINAPLQRNVNLPEPDGKLPDGRPSYSHNSIVKKLDAMVLTSSGKGYQGSMTVQLRNRAVKGLDAMVAYTYSFAKDQTNNPGSRASSAWLSNHTYGDLNDPELSYSQFAIPHRVVGSLSYRIEYLKHMATTISLYYSGSSTGRYSYIYKGDINGDYASGDLLYVPTGTSDPKFSFVDKISYNSKTKVAKTLLTAGEQYEAFMKYVDGNPYLSKRKGNFAERFGALQPWLNRFDLKLMQEFYSDFGTDHRYTLQVSLDFINVGNMLNSNWGVYKTAALKSSYGNILPVEMQRANTKSGAQKGFVLTESSIEDFSKKANVWNDNLGLSSTWGMLLGVKLLF